MANRPVSYVADANQQGRYVVNWDAIATADTIAPYENQGAAHSVTCTAIAAGSATVVIQGSDDGVTYRTLKDLQGTAISFTASGGAEFSTAARYIRPAITGGTSDDWNVTLSAAK